MSRSRTRYQHEQIRRRRQKDVVSARLGQTGLAVFRKVSEPQLDEVRDVLQESMAGRGIAIRGSVGQRDQALHLLRIDEVRKQEPLSKVPVGDAIAHLYKEVPALRAKVSAEIGKIAFLSAPRLSYSTMVLQFSQRTHDEFDAEREAILEEVEALPDEAVLNGAEFNWRSRDMQFIPLMRYPHADLSRSQMNIVGSVIEDIAPETVQLKAATFYYPK